MHRPIEGLLWALLAGVVFGVVFAAIWAALAHSEVLRFPMFLMLLVLEALIGAAVMLHELRKD